MPMDTAKAKLLADMCVLYWEYDTKPDFTGTLEPNSPEQLVLNVYDTLKQEVLQSYPWRSAIKYVTLTTSEPLTNTDPKYSRTAALPSDFLKEDAFWYDEKRNTTITEGIDIIGKTAKTNLERFTMSYISKDTLESNMDPWLISYLQIYIAAKAADIGGLSAERKSLLLQQADADFWNYSNTDWKMSHKENDALTESINQFVIS